MEGVKKGKREDCRGERRRKIREAKGKVEKMEGWRGGETRVTYCRYWREMRTF